MLFTKSAAMRDVAAFVERAGAARAGVIILGEDGTGRSVVAHAIHDRQTQRPGPFVTVDCGAFEAADLEAALFGGTPGDMQDLERVARGSLVDRANGGTLYLQNVSEASARVQAKLARILRDCEARSVESGSRVPIDVRPMAGVEPDVEESVRDGRIRDDLFRRIAAMRVDVPALRNRRDDIPELANYFVQEICTRMHTSAKVLTEAAHILIGALPWRGNATELRRLLESVMRAMNGQRHIGVEDILAQLRLEAPVVSPNGGTLRQARARFEREYITAVLDQHRGRVPDAARTLGIQRTNLYRKMRSLHVGRIKKDTNPISS
jgi:DNA-binding NtrC family response regulator